MQVYERIETVNSKSKFMEFVNELIKDNQNNEREWENKSISDYLEGINSWVDDLEGYYDNMKLQIPKDIDWRFVATLLYVGKIYE